MVIQEGEISLEMTGAISNDRVVLHINQQGVTPTDRFRALITARPIVAPRCFFLPYSKAFYTVV